MTILNVQQLAAALSKSGVTANMTDLFKNFLVKAVQQITGKQEAPTQGPREQIIEILDNVGPAAASAAVDYALSMNRHRSDFLTNDTLTGDEFSSFGSSIRQYLMPRYAYYNFDMLVDPRHRVDEECGYPRWITPIMYRYLYDRDDIAKRVVDIYPDECWAVDPTVYETEDEDDWTPFELDWKMLCEDHDLLGNLYRIDRLCGVGHYGVLLIGLDDEPDLSLPIVEPELLAGKRKTIAGKKRELLYLRPFDEYLSFINEYETDESSPRYGMPLYYNLVFVDMTINSGGAATGTRQNKRVHWSRVIHIMDNPGTSLVFGTPRQRPVFNRLLDLRKIKGGSGEMFWKGAFPGLSFEIDPRFVADNPDFDKDSFRAELAAYSDGLQRNLALIGIKANSLAPQVADPSAHVKMQMEAIATHGGIPHRVFYGSEEGRLASSQDKLTWNQRLGRRTRTFINPSILRAVVDRFVAIGIMRPTRNKAPYFTEWPDLNTPTDEDKSNLGLKFTQALSQYVASGVIHLIGPMDYLTIILGMRPSQAKRVVDAIDKAGGLKKLLEVDPSQGAGVNGKAQNNVSKGDRSGTTGSRDKKRDSNTKKVEGTAS